MGYVPRLRTSVLSIAEIWCSSALSYVESMPIPLEAAPYRPGPPYRASAPTISIQLLPPPDVGLTMAPSVPLTRGFRYGVCLEEVHTTLIAYI